MYGAKAFLFGEVGDLNDVRLENVTLRDGRLVVLRPACLDDAAMAIEHVNRVAAERRYLVTEELTASVEQEREYICKMAESGNLFLVAECEGRIAGSLSAVRGRGRFQAHTAEFGIALIPEFRGMGLGSKMVDYLIRWCRTRGVEKLNLEVFHDNDRALALYRRMGFVEEGVRRRQVRIDGRDIDLIQMTLFI